MIGSVRISNNEKSARHRKTIQYKLNHYQRTNNKLLCLYGITLNGYYRLLEQQDYKCAVCKVHQIEFPRALAIDHDHKTGKVRSLLCCRCNGWIVNLIENKEELFKNALEYLKRNKYE